MLNGYAGTILEVDLTKGVVRKEPLPEKLAREWIGGRGFVSKTLWDRVPAGADPLGPENIVVVATGPLTGAPSLGAGRTHFGAKSPATGGYGDANMGGHFAPDLKQAGYDMIVITGAAERPQYLFIDDDRVELRDAAGLWGLGTMKTEETLKKELGEEFQVATIGPAGEKLVNYSCISHDYGRQAARTGIGAVLGSKKLKAIVVRGTKTIPLADPAAVYAKGQEMYRAVFDNPGMAQWTPEGTAGVVDWVNEVGAFPTRNFSSNWFSDHKEIDGHSLLEKLNPISKGCQGCPTPCGKYSTTRTRLGEAPVEGPEYETVALVGGNLGLNDIREVAYLNHVIDDLGLDTISTGAVVGFTMECLQRGFVSKEKVGREVAFGDAEAALWLIKKIAAREGIGDLLARGVKQVSKEWGPEAQAIAPHVKGLEISGYEFRHAPAMMLAYATCDIGAHHSRAWAITYDVQVGQEKVEGKAQKVIELQHIRPIFDQLGVCRLQWVEIGFDYNHYPALLKPVLGREYTWDDLMLSSEKVWNLNRCFNIREIEGFGRGWDYPPARTWQDPVPDGPAKGKFIPKERVETLLDDYYRLRGWSADGLPTRAKLEALGLGEVAEQLGQRLPN